MDPPELTPPTSLREQTRLRNARKNCYAIFVCFLVVLIAAGAASIADTGSEDRVYIIIVVGSFLGGLTIPYSIVYVPIRWRVLRRLPAGVQALGLIGLTGMLATATGICLLLCRIGSG